jgi:membrane-bound lytic murein transglycosylase D
MRILAASCLLLTILYFALDVYPRLDANVQARMPLLSAYYLSRQLEAEIRSAEATDGPVPPSYASIIAQYDRVLQHREFVDLRDLSASIQDNLWTERPLLKFILWRRALPYELTTADPVAEIDRKLDKLREKERGLEIARSQFVEHHRIECLKQRPVFPLEGATSGRGLPPALVQNGFVFCGESVPVNRPDVRRRIEHQLDYLLNDLRETTGLWLRRKDRYAPVIEEVLLREGMPTEFHLLPALESGYSRAIVSPSMATGWWQFVRPTAIQSLSAEKELDWTLQIDGQIDQRKDLVLSTRSAARYLKWIRSRLGGAGEQGGWLTTAAAYNAGFDEVRHRIAVYGTTCYWDMKLPSETENYIPRWLAFSIIDSHRSQYQMEGTSATPLTFDSLEEVRLAKDVPLTLIATLTHSSVRFIRELNGALNHDQMTFRVPPKQRSDGACTIHVPRGTKDVVLEELKSRGYLKEGQ